MEESHAELSLEPVAAAEAEKTESFDVIDYVRELFLNSEEQKKLEQKKLKLMRTCVALLSVVAFVVVVSAAVLATFLPARGAGVGRGRAASAIPLRARRPSQSRRFKSEVFMGTSIVGAG